MAPSHKKSVLSTSAKAVDPSLDALFSTSAKPVASQNRPKYVGLITPKARPAPKTKPVKELDEEELAAKEDEDEDGDDDDQDEDEDEFEEASDKAEDESAEEVETAEPEPKKGLGKRKRKARDEGEDLEGRYMDKLARETAPAEKRPRRTDEDAEDVNMDDEQEEEAEDDEADKPLVHEALGEKTGSTAAGAGGVPETEKEKAARTVFLSNVNIEAVTSRTAKKTLLAHLASPLEAMNAAVTEAAEAAAAVAAAEAKPAATEESSEAAVAATTKPAGPTPVLATVESLRFRSVPFATAAMPKRAAFITKAVMGATAQATNAYAVYSTAAAARQAVRQLNGTVVLGRHLRADSVAHPAAVDHRRCVFVGNLGFMDDEEVMVTPDESKADEDGQPAEPTKRKRFKVPMDVEEGLWRTFGKHAGAVESVRVVRDPATRVGKGFAYVQFVDGTSVEAALLLAGRKFPPLLPRELRVSRCKAPQKTLRAVERQQQAAAAKINTRRDDRKRTRYAPKPTAEQQSAAGRAAKLLGRAAARTVTATGPNADVLAPADGKPLVFEGTRARAGQGGGIGGKKSRGAGRNGGAGKNGGKTSNNDERRAKRASSWRGKTKR